MYMNARTVTWVEGKYKIPSIYFAHKIGSGDKDYLVWKTVSKLSLAVTPKSIIVKPIPLRFVVTLQDVIVQRQTNCDNTKSCYKL